MTNKSLAVPAEQAERWLGSRSATSLSTGPQPSGRSTVAAQQAAKSRINDHLLAGYGMQRENAFDYRRFVDFRQSWAES